MTSVTYQDGRVGEFKDSVKVEINHSLIDSIPSYSTIAQFIQSGQAAFGSVNPQLSQRGDNASGEVQKWMLDQVRKRLAVASELYQDDILILRSLLKLEYSVTTTGYRHLRSELSRLMRTNLTNAVAFTKSLMDATNDQVPRDLKDEVVRDVAQGLGDVSIDMRKPETIEHQRAAFTNDKNRTSPEPYPLEKLSAVELGEFTKKFYSMGLYKPVNSMLGTLRSEMDRALPSDLHTLYVPYLQELIGLMLVYGIPMNDPTYSALFESVLRNYFQRFLGEMPKQNNSPEHNLWIYRAEAARVRLESFEDYYFRDILGDRYDTVVLPALMTLRSSPKHPQAHDQCNLSTSSAGSGTGSIKRLCTRGDGNINSSLIRST